MKGLRLVDKPRILLVEDDREILSIVAINLEMAGMDPIKAHDGESAVEILKDEKPDCVILDVVLPEMSGWDVLNHINSTPELSDIPVVMMTGRTADKDRLRGLSAGAVKYITKPFNPPELLEAINEALKPDAKERLVRERKNTIERIQLSALKQLSELLLSSIELNELLHRVAQKLTVMLELPFCVILLHDREVPTLYIFTNDESAEGNLVVVQDVKYQNISQDLKKSFSESNHPALINDLKHLKLEKLFADPEELVDGYVMPLIEREEYLGVIMIGGKTKVGSSPGEYDLLSTFANQVSSAVVRARLHENVRRDKVIRQHLLHQMITAQERERSRLASDIHDSAVQSLVGVSYQLQAMARKWAAKYPDAKVEIDGVEENLNASIKELRNILHGIRPLYLEDIGLTAALESLLRDFGSRNNVQTSLLLSDELPLLAKEASVNLFRVVQEALMNVEKHAQASHTSVEIHSVGNRIVLTVSDDGAGFIERLTKSEKGHLGIAGMRERAELLEGTLKIKSMPGEGTTVTLDMPLKKAIEEPYWKKSRR